MTTLLVLLPWVLLLAMAWRLRVAIIRERLAEDQGRWATEELETLKSLLRDTGDWMRFL